MDVSFFSHRWLARHHFALIDASARDELPGHWPHHVLAPAFLGRDTSRCPVLLDLDLLAAGEQATFMQQVQDQLEQREPTLCSLLMSARGDTEPLARHLTSRLVLPGAAGEPPGMLRWFDPGTFLQMPDVLGATGMAALLGPVDSVLVPWAGEWQQVDPPPSTATPPLWRLTAQQHDELFRRGAVNRVALAAAPARDQRDWIERCRIVGDHVRRAHIKHGLTQMRDQIAFAHHALQHHPRFDEHAALVELFDALHRAQPEDELDYLELSSRIDDHQWSRIASELQRGTAPTMTPTEPLQ